jgi:hypothetical protein
MAQKYRQQGYQDSDWDDDRRPERKKPPQRTGPVTPEDRARRRGVRHAMDRDARAVLRCPTCGRSVEDPGTITPTTACPHCNTALRTCRACQHFDSGARWQCRADITEAVSDKGKVNSCTKYEPRLVLDATGKRSAKPSFSDPKSAFENLFKR